MKKILVILAIFILVLINNKEENIIIPNDAIRFRVIANSNTFSDQTVKLKLSTYIQNYIYNLTKNYTNSEKVNEVLLENYDNLNQEIETYLQENNINMSYKLSIGNNYFPKKNYKGINYAAGYYNSVVIELGNHQGNNWWCVIYPPLCLVDEEKNDVEYRSYIKELIESYNL